jgi:MSHA pilin protein MshD
MCTRDPRPGRVRGVSLVELILFILIVSVAIVGILGVLNLTAARSSDPLIRKQVLAIAESLLEEIELMPFTICDPTDANAATATSTAGCATLAENLGPETTALGLQSRYSTTNPFNNVNDYNGFNMNGIRDLSNTLIPGLGNYSASVSITNGSLGAISSAEVLLIAVTVTGPGNESATLHGYRTRYAPNTLP